MKQRTPYDIIHARYVTEKSRMIEQLKNNTANPSIKRFESSKYVFLVDVNSCKTEIAAAIETIYSAKNVKVKKVNVINVKAKKRRVRGRIGFTSAFKKAIVTFEKGDVIEEQV